MGRELPSHPTLFAKYTDALIGAHDDIALPPVSDAMDWEAELAVVVGSAVRHADEETAREAIAGFTIVNDVTARDWQSRTQQWLQGKTFESTTPVGPWLVTPEEAGSGLDCAATSTTSWCRRRTRPTSCSDRSARSATSPTSSRCDPAT